MNKFLRIGIVALSLFVLLVGCKSKKSEADIKGFLISKEGTFGWVTAEDSISFDFFPDGRLHIQGPGGESTMWEGKWSVSGTQVILERTDLGKTETLDVNIDGEKLILGGKIFTRYIPQ